MTTKTATLDKGRERFILTYEEGSEGVAIDALIAMVHRHEIDWWDAALLAHQLGKVFVLAKSKAKE